jgi:hypothetical protein
MTNKLYNSGKWTEARFNSFIKSGLRKLSQKWPPRFEIISNARVERGVYICAGYKRPEHKVRYKDGINVDHIKPIMKGNPTWNTIIKRMFCEKDGLQLLCKTCHNKKTKDERMLL